MKTVLPFAILILLACVVCSLIDPLMYWMPSMVQMYALTIAAVFLILWVAFVLLEGEGDERDSQLRAFAGRTAYLSGVGILTMALVVQGFRHTIDPWVPITLIGMVATKLFARLYGDHHF